MNESYSTKISLKNNYISLDKLTKIIREADEIEDEIFGEYDEINYTPSQECLNVIYSYL